jgi:hypothetical protein
MERGGRNVISVTTRWDSGRDGGFVEKQHVRRSAGVLLIKDLEGKKRTMVLSWKKKSNTEDWAETIEIASCTTERFVMITLHLQYDCNNQITRAQHSTIAPQQQQHQTHPHPPQPCQQHL